MDTFCMLVANSAEARLYTGASPVGTLSEIAKLENKTARLKEADLVTDKEGRMRDDGQGRSAMERDPMEEEITAFARQIADQLEKMRTSGGFDALSIVAEPGFLGHLRNQLSGPTSDLVLEEIPKNVGTGEVEQAQGYLTRLTK